MKLDLSFPELVKQRELMGAHISDWVPGAKNLDPRSVLLNELESGIPDISLEDVETTTGGLLTYKGEQVILYIKDTRSDLETLRFEPEKSRRFHVAECKALDIMREKGRFQRYVVTNRTDGNFLVDWFNRFSGERGEIEAGLKVCKYCLGTLNWRGYEHARDRLKMPDESLQSKSDIWAEFNISEFLMEFSTFFRSKPSRRDTDAELNVYVKDWPRISESMRRERKWKCEDCGVDLSEHPGLLHCHHKSGVVTDNTPSNLMVLCAIDHAAQPGHHHMKIPPKHRQKILELRVRQKL